MGHSVTVAGPASGALEGGERSLGGVRTVTISGTESGLGVDPSAFAAIGRLLREPFDIVHVHEPLTPITPWLALLRARAPLVGTFHVHREGGHRLYGAWGWALQPLARRLRARIAVSEAARDTAAPHFRGEYDIVPNGIDVEAFRALRARPADWPAHRRTVLYIGRLEPRKGVEHLVRAIALVQQRADDVELVIVGDGRERARLEMLASRTGARVRFAGRVSDEALPAYVQAADIVCSPALRGESFGIVLLEAMACGKPVVASRIAGYEALVGRAECGMLVPPGDDEACAAALLSLANAPALRAELGARGAAAADGYRWPAIAARLDAIYRRLLA
jgi:phosphatidylinositol alpha-mannosyltransferase